MSRINDLMSGPMSHHASRAGMLGESLTLFNFEDVNTDPTDAPDWQMDDGTSIEGHVDWYEMGDGADVDDTVGGEEVRTDVDLFIPLKYDVRDGRASGEKASVVEDNNGNEFRVELARVEAGVYRCPSRLRQTATDE